jgi:hypothetical protein
MTFLIAFIGGMFSGSACTAYLASLIIVRLQHRLNHQATVAEAVTERMRDLMLGRWPTAWK